MFESEEYEEDKNNLDPWCLILWYQEADHCAWFW